jgi:hypothetical protein
MLKSSATGQQQKPLPSASPDQSHQVSYLPTTAVYLTKAGAFRYCSAVDHRRGHAQPVPFRARSGGGSGRILERLFGVSMPPGLVQVKARPEFSNLQLTLP